MRTLSAALQTKADQRYALESVLFVRVFWNGTPYDYSDKDKLLEISGLEDSASLDTKSVNVNVVLDDSDGFIKQVFDHSDVHKIKVQVFQSFVGVDDKLLLFTGQMNTPIEWSESERKFSFTILSKVEDRELGFSFEEGLFPNLPSESVGRPWPLVFGTVVKVPAFQFSPSPTAITAQGFCLIDELQYDEEAQALFIQADLAIRYSRDYAAQASAASLQASKYNDGQPDPADDYEQYVSYMEQYSQLMTTATQYFIEASKLNLDANKVIADKLDKKRYAFNPVRIASSNLPQNKVITIELGSTRLRVRVQGATIFIIEEIIPEERKPSWGLYVYNRSTVTSQQFGVEQKVDKFRWFDGGSKINVISEPIYYIVALGVGKIAGVFGRMRGLTVRVPSDLFDLEDRQFTNEAGTTIHATVLKMHQPLSSLRDQDNQQVWDSDEVFCDTTGEIAGTFKSIVTWVTDTFTDLTLDTNSFATLPDMPMNFYYDQRVSSFEFLKQLCFQARCACWVNDEKLYFRYLAAVPTPVTTISYDDVVEDSMTIYCSETESLLTKLTANWKFTYDQKEFNKVITRHNVEKYGLMEQSYDYFAFNHVDLVQKSIGYWAIYFGTTWRRVNLSLFINKLKVEANDAVTIDMVGLVADEQVIGIVETAVYDSNTQQIDCQIWLPVRWGEMTTYKWAYPAQVTDVYGKLQDPEIQTGNPFQGVKDNGFVLEANAGSSVITSRYKAQFRLDDLQPVPSNDAEVSTYLTDVTVTYRRPFDISTANNRLTSELKAPVAIAGVDDNAVGVDFGTVESYDEETRKYQVRSVTGTVRTVTQALINPDYKVRTETPVIIVKKRGLWYMQAPVWSAE